MRKPRPVVIVQDDAFDATDSIAICAFTPDPTETPLFRLPVEPSERYGLRSSSRLTVDKITTVAKSNVGERIGRLDDEDVAQLNQAVIVFLGLTVSPRSGRKGQRRNRSGPGDTKLDGSMASCRSRRTKRPGKGHTGGGHMRAIAGAGAVVLLAACTPFLPRQDASNPTVVGAAKAIPAYTVENEKQAPKVTRIIGRVEGDSCEFWPTERRGSEAEALEQMRLKALALGANGITDVRYQRRGASFVTNCWQSVTARGEAVVFEPAAKAVKPAD